MKAMERAINKLELELAQEIKAANDAVLDEFLDALPTDELEALISLIRRHTEADGAAVALSEEEAAMIPCLEKSLIDMIEHPIAS